jgi:hypothetical protein
VAPVPSRRFLALALLLAAYFVYFAADGLTARWAPDDMMNDETGGVMSRTSYSCRIRKMP